MKGPDYRVSTVKALLYLKSIIINRFRFGGARRLVTPLIIGRQFLLLIGRAIRLAGINDNTWNSIYFLQDTSLGNS